MTTLNRILENKIIAIIRGADPNDVMKITEALLNGGVTTIEVTMNSPKALSVIEKITEEFGDQVLVGAGTVLDAETARHAILAGAKFILSPTVNSDTINLTKRYGAISIPGGFTPTEVLSAYENGGDIIKVFPGILGPSYIKDILGPLPQIPLLPTGGVDLENINAFLKAGAVGCGIGSALVNSKQQVNEEYIEQLTSKARQFVSKVKEGSE
ncbi:bifunctional 4-hydroxy-2-oxoglutarate aldolase/2-dehydro-3-deoxy-phosphogluconate aldolase [Metabacillus halosaccharovorans]|uniref:bifunctional 4-hydroxy-2-oxoglutarate aldolase/2-dehydro-3-deoxy-phosphogluconate aldolase n=1 Tax=Metabacillus halosaccharovorans TaxID=930124 RepID=UPI001C1F61F5|nr:bifunctional 4-hydroxy-2-oxoglutarate aldolase/2-dehydro-3-deoxy-phosphogluconate aldolase [Metabacillus halosaccharovorans]MBU7591717.1 bifunctional 4-hydroxy-2-oxoglutarate aldolase/2-dehydro-3-deoxy-phosphogluconate aldolase [Metabacillus halosaccharovorans]